MQHVRLLFVLVSVLAGYVAQDDDSWGWGNENECTTPDNIISTCITITECKIIYNFIAQSGGPSNMEPGVIESLKKYFCGSGQTVQVCCPPSLPILFTTRISRGDEGHPNAYLLPENCGRSAPRSRITNGNITDLFEFPWAVALKYQYNSKDTRYLCGGSIINDRYILTAAHCIRNEYPLIGVRLGEHNFDSSIDCVVYPDEEEICADPPQDFDVSVDDAIVHPEYSANTLATDIALIRLRRKANVSIDSVHPICLPLTVSEKARNFEFYTVIGWGKTESLFPSEILLKVNVPKVDIPQCALRYPKVNLTDKQLCAGGKKQDSCAGDSGGPLSAEIVKNSQVRTIQYGLVSFGPQICGVVGIPAVYTNVTTYIRWILDNIKP